MPRRALRPIIYAPAALALVNLLRAPKRKRLVRAAVGAALGVGAVLLIGEERLPALPLGD